MNILNLDEADDMPSPNQLMAAARGETVVIYGGREWLLALNEDEQKVFMESLEDGVLFLLPEYHEGLRDLYVLCQSYFGNAKFIAMPIQKTDDQKMLWRLHILPPAGMVFGVDVLDICHSFLVKFGQPTVTSAECMAVDGLDKEACQDLAALIGPVASYEPWNVSEESILPSYDEERYGPPVSLHRILPATIPVADSKFKKYKVFLSDGSYQGDGTDLKQIEATLEAYMSRHPGIPFAIIEGITEDGQSYVISGFSRSSKITHGDQIRLTGEDSQ